MSEEGERSAVPEYYDIDLRIEPDKGELEAQVTFKVHPAGKEIEFDIHETFEIDSLTLNGSNTGYSTESNEPTPVNPASKKVILLEEKISENEVHEITVNYHGSLKDIPEFKDMDQEIGLDDRIEPDHIELASYSRWYPGFDYGNKFDLDLTLDIPGRLKTICSGYKIASKENDGRRIEDWTSEKDTDVVIVASPDFKRKTVEGSFGEFSVYYTQLSDDWIAKEVEEAGQCIEFFQDILGKSHLSGRSFKNVYSPKEVGQGAFSRRGMIVYSEGMTLDALKEDPERSLLKGNAHEIAHFWFDFGSGKSDWINETFAEYFSLLAVEKIVSEDKFEYYLDRFEELVKDLPEDAPSISEVEPYNDEVNYIVRYYKGALMLHEMRKRLEEEKFLQRSREFYEEFKDRGITTSKFRSFWQEGTDEIDRELMNDWLDS